MLYPGGPKRPLMLSQYKLNVLSFLGLFGPFLSFLVIFLLPFFVGNGNAVPWWSQDTIDAFTVQAQCFVDQYGNYSVPEIASIVGEENAHVLPFLLIIVSWVVEF